MMKMTYFRRSVAVAFACALALPMSASGESRTRNETDLAQLARELERVLGKGSVEISRGGHPEPATSRRADVPTRNGRDDSTTAILAEMNRERARRGLNPLRFDSRLNAAAADRAADMFSRGYFDHVSPDGRSPFLSVKKRGYRYAAVGENLAVGYRTPQSVVSSWMRSPGHRENVLGKAYDEVGLALIDGSPVRGYGGPTVVAFYARER